MEKEEWDGVERRMDMQKQRLELEDQKRRLEDEDELRDTQRKMAWFALFGMLLYPFAVVIAEFAGLNKAADILGDMAATYFVSTAAIVMALFGAEAYKKTKG